MTQIAILDFDGTLADTRGIITATFQDVIREMGLPARTDGECAATIGLPLTEAFIRLFGASPAEAQRMTDTYRRIFTAQSATRRPEPFPHVIATLSELHRRGITVTIASSRSHASLSEYASLFGITDVVSLILGAEDVAHAKPAPDAVLLTLSRFGIAAADALVVGDTAFDIRMGRSAGARAVGVSYGNGSPEQLLDAGAEAVVDDFADILLHL